MSGHASHKKEMEGKLTNFKIYLILYTYEWQKYKFGVKSVVVEHFSELKNKIEKKNVRIPMDSAIYIK
jgi:hypothetical protein